MYISRKLKQGIIWHLWIIFPFSGRRKCVVTGISNYNRLTLRNFSHWQISSKINRLIEVLKVVSSSSLMKNWIKERDQAQGFQFCLASCLADQLILLAAWMLPNQAKFSPPPKRLIVMRCGKQFLRNERNKFLFKTGLPSVYSFRFFHPSLG